MSVLDTHHLAYGGVVMGHGVGPCIGPNEIKSSSPMTNFITINYLFNFIFGFIR